MPLLCLHIAFVTYFPRWDGKKIGDSLTNIDGILTVNFIDQSLIYSRDGKIFLHEENISNMINLPPNISADNANLTFANAYNRKESEFFFVILIQGQVAYRLNEMVWHPTLSAKQTVEIFPAYPSCSEKIVQPRFRLISSVHDAGYFHKGYNGSRHGQCLVVYERGDIYLYEIDGYWHDGFFASFIFYFGISLGIGSLWLLSQEWFED